MKSQKNDFLIQTNFLTMIRINLFYCCKKVFTLSSKMSMNHHFLKKNIFRGTSNMEDITDAHYAQVKRVCKDFEIKQLGENHDLYVQSDTLFLLGVFENFRNMCFKIYVLDPAHFLSAPGLAWKTPLKKIKTKLDLLTDTHMLLMVEKVIRGKTC